VTLTVCGNLPHVHKGRYEHVRCRLQFHYTARFQLPIIHVVFYMLPNHQQLLGVTAIKLNNMVARNKRKKLRNTMRK